MTPLVLYCKSYHRDVLRAARLAESIRQHNLDSIQFYLSCPTADLPLFRDKVGTDEVILIADEDILATNPAIDMDEFASLPGYLSQQIVKSEFWRLGLSENYVCLDSDGYFIRDFNISDFLAPNGNPYTVINESLELRTFGSIRNHPQISKNIDLACEKIMSILARPGRHYDFGPLPVIWNRLVWKELADQYLTPNNLSFLDVITLFPSEMRWYGEALLKYRPIELWPIETLFRCYHYEEQFDLARKAGETDSSLAKVYLGVCVQSNWDRSMSFGRPEKNIASRIVRYVKRRIFHRLV